MNSPDKSKQGYLQRAKLETARVIRAGITRYRNLSLLAKVLVWLFLLVNVVVWTLFIHFTPAKIAQVFFDWSQKLKNERFGWLILSALMVVTSLPPLVGYSTCISLCGFAWGLNGFWLAAPATIIGSLNAFILLRYLLLKRFRIHQLESENWKALHSIIKERGLPLIILIRLSPFPPHVYSNALFASILSVSWWQFLIATFFILPKIFLTVFVASRIAQLSDGDTRGQMDTTSKILNISSAVVGVLIGMTASFVVYVQMRKELKAAEERAPPHNNEDEPLLGEPLMDPEV